jgi:hypothetical protein
MNENEGADASESTEQESAPDPIKNVKAEFERKYGNVESKLSALEQTNRALAEQLSKFQAGPAKAASDDLDPDEVLTNTGQFVNKLINKVSKSVESTLESRSRADNERAQVLAALVQDYPELQQAGSEMYQETLKSLGELPQEMQASSHGYKMAAYKAAANLGLQPKQRRAKKDSEASDDFSFKGGKSAAPKKQAKSEIDPKILMTAELFGIDITDEKELEDLKKYTKREYWRSE